MIEVYFDGLCEPVNPGGVATYGYVIYKDGNIVIEGEGVIGKGSGMTNNIAEYTALLKAAAWLNQYASNEKITIKGDSKLVINQVSGVWRIKSETSQTFVPLIKELLKDMEVRLIWIPREANKYADALSRKAYREA